MSFQTYVGHIRRNFRYGLDCFFPMHENGKKKKNLKKNHKSVFLNTDKSVAYNSFKIKVNRVQCHFSTH